MSERTRVVSGETRALAAQHLDKARSFAEEGDLAGAEGELARALALVPSDVASLKLLALVRFKRSRLPEARETYRVLARICPEDTGVRVHLGLIGLKLDWIDEAVAELEVATRLRPEDPLGWVYLGYAYARAGRNDAAADAFRQGDRQDLARQVSGAPVIPGAVGALSIAPPAPDDITPAPVVGMDDSEDEAAAAMSEWVPEPLSAMQREAMPAGVDLGSFVMGRLLPEPACPPQRAAEVFFHGPELLRFEMHGRAVVRGGHLASTAGNVTLHDLRQRQRGRTTDGLMRDAAGTLFEAKGQGDLWLSGTEPHGLMVWRLQDDCLFVRQERLVAFSDAIVWESGRVPGGDGTYVQLRGSGRVVVGARDQSVAVAKVGDAAEGGEVFVPSARLLGWMGQVVVTRARGLADGCDAGIILSCHGVGVVMVAKGPVTRPAIEC